MRIKICTVLILMSLAAMSVQTVMAKGSDSSCPTRMKPGADVCLASPGTIHLKPGEAERVVSVRLAGRDSNGVRWQILNPEMGSLVEATAHKMTGLQETPQAGERYLKVKAPDNGFGYVRLMLIRGQGQSKRIRVLAIPVVVGNTDPKALLKRPGRLLEGPAGEAVISMDGQ
jgi:hypothetical protein